MTIQLKIPDIACSACVNTVTQAIKSVDGNATVEADTTTKIVNAKEEGRGKKEGGFGGSLDSHQTAIVVNDKACIP